MAEERLESLFDSATVHARIEALAARIARDADGVAPLLLCIAEGSLRFAEVLARGLAARGLAPERLVVRAHRSDGTQLGALELERFDIAPLRGRDVLVVDDLCDEGETLAAVLELCAEAEPRTLRTAVLVDKRERRRTDVRIDYAGFVVERGWLVGFGMDLDGRHRELDWIGRLADDRF